MAAPLNDEAGPAADWSTQRERGSLKLLRLMAWIAVTLGRGTARLVLHPIALAACGFAAMVASLVVSVLRRWVRVGAETPSGTCRHCGYHAARNKICPECGKVNPNAHV